MRDLISKGLLTAAAASSVLSLSGGSAQAADADATAAGSPGVASGNSLQLPLDIPVNICGNTVNPIGLLNPVFGNACVNGTPAAPPERPRVPETPEAPEEVPEDITPPEDRSVLRPTPAAPPHHVPHTGGTPRPAAPVVPPGENADAPRLAATGGDPRLLATAASSVGLILGGALLYRRAHVAARR
ncbi:chaplin family protein [Streptomyces sp. NPDC088258]|uniref:chaplin n=1 Tax=Streptomyces sp. NPDC088258 TaxID=3365849 RepID=UPI00380FAF9F